MALILQTGAIKPQRVQGGGLSKGAPVTLSQFPLHFCFIFAFIDCSVKNLCDILTFIFSRWLVSARVLFFGFFFAGGREAN